MRVKCLAHEHNTVSPARARTRTARSGDERTDHEATTFPKALNQGWRLFGGGAYWSKEGTYTWALIISKYKKCYSVVPKIFQTSPTEGIFFFSKMPLPTPLGIPLSFSYISHRTPISQEIPINHISSVKEVRNR